MSHIVWRARRAFLLPQIWLCFVALSLVIYGGGLNFLIRKVSHHSQPEFFQRLSVFGVSSEDITTSFKDIISPNYLVSVQSLNTGDEIFDSTVNKYVDLKVAEFINFASKTPAVESFKHQFSASIRVDYISKRALSLVVSIDEYHTGGSVNNSAKAFLYDRGNHKQIFWNPSKKVFANLLGLKADNFGSLSDQEMAVTISSNYTARLAVTSKISEHIKSSKPYIDVPLDDVIDNDLALKNLYFPGYPDTITKKQLQILGDSVVSKQKRTDIISDAKLIKHNCTIIKCIALTFDDGPDAATTPKILDILKNRSAVATFFVLGSHVSQNVDLTRRIKSEGHEIGNHSFNHIEFTKLTPVQIQGQINDTNSALVAAGVGSASTVRPPYGSRNSKVIQAISQPIILWNIDPKDWKATDPTQIFENIKTQARPNAIILLHDTHKITVDSIDQVLDFLQSNDYQLVTVSDLLNLTPTSKGEFSTR